LKWDGGDSADNGGFPDVDLWLGLADIQRHQQKEAGESDFD